MQILELWGMFLARAAQQRQQFGTQRLARQQGAGKKQEQRSEEEIRKHGSTINALFRPCNR
ncbi:protein of unknown function [Georgfuchsia toluolica]|uniref:Uncharacterized protein n=1 Tax=Georgfuchsia toluolica TaxID=424218 RepID=A0A916J8A5_9PROT|nr:protein of unknown function [Georgfuchsia toluolica]